MVKRPRWTCSSGSNRASGKRRSSSQRTSETGGAPPQPASREARDSKAAKPTRLRFMANLRINIASIRDRLFRFLGVLPRGNVLELRHVQALPDPADLGGIDP